MNLHGTLAWILMLVFLSRINITQTVDCGVNEYKCINNNCISLSLVNNTINDCEDNSDEGPLQDCMLTTETRKTKFQCNNYGLCIEYTWRLDGEPDCPDGSDEVKLLGSRCWVNQTLDPLCCPCEQYINDSECWPLEPPPLDKLKGTCRCRSGWRGSDNRTVCSKRQLGDPCLLDPDCYDAINNTICERPRNVCNCQLGYQRIGDGCVQRKVQDNCARDMDCTTVIINSTCAAGRCSCVPGYLATADRTECIKPTLARMTCTLTRECDVFFNNSECREGQCLCKPAFYPSLNLFSCLPYWLNSTCQDISGCQAAVNNTDCTRGRCACSPGYYAVNDARCDPRIIGIGGCIADVDCSTMLNSRCETGTCVCVTGYQSDPTGKNCAPRRIGEQCTREVDCRAVMRYSTCIGNQCRCEIGYKASADGMACNALRIGDECTATADCLAVMDNTNCSALQKCACAYGHQATGDQSRCVRTQLQDMGCQRDSDCLSVTPHTRCVTTKCACDERHYPSMDGTTCDPLQVGSLPCASDSRCTLAIPGSECDPNGICSCKLGTYATIEATSCVDISIGKSFCNSRAMCLLAIVNSDCINGVCRCAAGFKPLTGRTCVESQLGQPCQVTDLHCLPYIDHSTCLGGFCACMTGFNSTDDIACRPVTEEVSCSVGCSAICGLFIGMFLGALFASLLVLLILWKKILRNQHSERKVAPAAIVPYGMNPKWQLDWNNRPPAHIAVMYKSPSLRPPEELYGDLLDLNVMEKKLALPTISSA